jgi:hypothetical protein
MAAFCNDLLEDDVAFLILQALVQLSGGITDRIRTLLMYVSTIVDIEPHEEIPRGVSYGPRVHCSIDDFRSDDDARMKTNFTPAELRQLLRFFRLNQAARADGFIRIKGYRFRPEEILIFVLRKLKNATSNSSLCGDVFGGDPRKWSHAMKWFYSRADLLIGNHVSLNLVERFRDDLPLFAEKLANLLRRGFQVENEDGTFEHVPGIDYSDPDDPFRIFGFLDCSNFRSSTPATGPSGRYEGAARNPYSYVKQRSYYNGWKKIHGLKILSILLPNGLSLMHGPISVRRNDIDHAHLSGMNNYLLNLQANQEFHYCVYGDGVFRDLVAFDSVFRSYNRPAPGAPLTEFQDHENTVFKKLRVSIEHSYGAVDNAFDVIKIKREWKLMNVSSVHPSKMRLLFFLSNCYTCIHGNSASKRFDCDPPSFEEFLFP